MDPIINTAAWLMEKDAANTVSLTNRETGLTLMLQGRGIIGGIKDALKTHSPDKVAAVYAKAGHDPADWVKVYKIVPAFH